MPDVGLVNRLELVTQNYK